MTQERLWITEPARATCLAEVTAVRGDWFVVDRALFAPLSRACRHPQPADKGTIWCTGSKRRLAGTRVGRDGLVELRIRDFVPAVGDKLQCELDQDWRGHMARGHTAMHLLLAEAEWPMGADPEVRGDGHVRFTFQGFVAPPALAEWLQRSQLRVAADTPISARYAHGDDIVRSATPQQFTPPDPLPGGDPVALVDAGPGCVFPCDGTHVDRTGRVGRLVIVHARHGKDGFVVVAKAEAAR